MGFFDEINKSSEESKLNTSDFEVELSKKMCDEDILHIKWKAEEQLGLHFNDSLGRADVYDFTGEVITLSPEPITILKEFNDISDDKVSCDILFREKIKGFKQLELNKIPTIDGEHPIWRAKTSGGINLRPGHLNDRRDNFQGIELCDDSVHGLIVGRTGSGKSVFINQLILSLITEYAPWELDIYLADFKKVELSRYMNDSDEGNNFNPFTPHIKACAATSEIRYVISMIKYIVDCMNARQELFTRLGVTKLQEFRNKYNVVLPRVIFIVDEFQQMFTEATSREHDEIQFLLNSITKLGRATGFHLIFASQEMGGTLSGNTLANFKVRMALPCDGDVSSNILGNPEAENLERGYVLINTESGNVLNNKKFRVPCIEVDKKDSDESKDKTPFFSYLDKIKNNAHGYDLDFKRDTQKFYREELQEKERLSKSGTGRPGYLDDLDKLTEHKVNYLDSSVDIFDAIVLGNTVMYNPIKNDKVAMYIERGNRKSVLVASPNKDDIARILKLLAENLIRSKFSYNIGIELDGIVTSKFNLESKIKEHQDYYRITNQADGMLLGQQILSIRENSLRQLRDRKPDNVVDKLSRLMAELREYYKDANLVDKHDRYEFALSDAKSKLEDLNSSIADYESLTPDTGSENPIIKFLSLCSSGLRVITDSSESINLEKLGDIYDEIIDDLKASIDIENELLNQIDKVSKALETDDYVEINQLRLKILRIILKYLNEKISNIEVSNNPILNNLDRYYNLLGESIEKFIADLVNKSECISVLSELYSSRDEAIIELDAVTGNKDAITLCIEAIHTCVIEHIMNCIDRSELFDKDSILKSFDVEVIPTCSKLINLSNKVEQDNPIIRQIENICEALEYSANNPDIEISSTVFERIIIWLVGLDKIDRYDNKFNEDLEKYTDYNMLPIVASSSPVDDIFIKSAFDYYFITGNNEKIYDRVNARYTKQAIGSIVVNSGIISNGVENPFKMYKSELDTPITSGFMIELLNNLDT